MSVSMHAYVQWSQAETSTIFGIHCRYSSPDHPIDFKVLLRFSINNLKTQRCSLSVEVNESPCGRGGGVVR